jgi:hypothetical protein
MEKAAAFCGFNTISEYRSWLAQLKKEKRAADQEEAKAESGSGKWRIL